MRDALSLDGPTRSHIYLALDFPGNGCTTATQWRMRSAILPCQRFRPRDGRFCRARPLMAHPRRLATHSWTCFRSKRAHQHGCGKASACCWALQQHLRSAHCWPTPTGMPRNTVLSLCQMLLLLATTSNHRTQLLPVLMNAPSQSTLRVGNAAETRMAVRLVAVALASSNRPHLPMTQLPTT